MKRIVMRILSLLFITGSLFAGETISIKIDDNNFKLLKITLDAKNHDNVDDKLLVTVKVLDQGIGKIYVFSENKNTEIKPVIKDGTATINFEITKESVEKSYLHFGYANGKKYPKSYQMNLKDFIN